MFLALQEERIQRHINYLCACAIANRRLAGREARGENLPACSWMISILKTKTVHRPESAILPDLSPASHQHIMDSEHMRKLEEHLSVIVDSYYRADVTFLIDERFLEIRRLMASQA